MLNNFSIAFFGSSIVSAYWNGAATYYRGILREMARRGARITFYEPDAYDRQKHRDIPDPDWLRVVVYPSDGTAGVYRALAEARNADLLVKASGIGVFDELLEQEILNVRRRGSLTAFWDVDAPATLERVRREPSLPFARLIRAYDFVFTYGGGQPVRDEYTRLGARQCVPIYNALDPETHYRVEREALFAADLSFLGNRLPDREARVEEFFWKAAAACPSSQFLLGGSGWEDKPKPANVRYAGFVSPQEHNAFNSSAKAVLNISRESMARFGFSPATRVFEAAGAASCLITDFWDGIEQFFEPGKEILVAHTGGEVADLVNSLDERRARRIGEAARERVLAHHTYAARAAEWESAVLHSPALVGAFR